MATLKETVNDMVFKLRLFSSEVTRVSLDVGTMGQLGGQAVVTGVEGTWKTRSFLSLSPLPLSISFECGNTDFDLLLLVTLVTETVRTIFKTPLVKPFAYDAPLLGVW